jgi:serine/threonine protein kinase
MKHILVAEDEEGIRRYLSVLLQRQGFMVSDVADGNSALEFIKTSRESPNLALDLLITDIDMPGLGGLELLEELEKANIFMPSMIITGSQDRRAIIDALRHGCAEFIDKPVMEKDLLKRLHATLEKVDKRQQEVLDNTRTMNDLGRLSKPQIIGNYKIIRPLGEGASGTVYLCEGLNDQLQYAMKVLRLNVFDDDEKEIMVKRFVHESEATSLLQHPNIVNFIEFGYDEDIDSSAPFIVMEYFNATPLTYFMKRNPDLSLNDKIFIIRQLAQALAAVHGKGISHRDIKPDNILVDKSLHIKVTDFGICHLPKSDLTMTSDLMGSPGYMAPEYLEYGVVNSLIDIYAMGVVAYELFLGVRPFEDETLIKLVKKITGTLPVEPRKIDPEFPLGLQNILAGMLEKHPEKRYQDAEEVIKALNDFEQNEDAGFFIKFRNTVGKNKCWS